ncbi:MAG: cysteine--tRNA ligase [Polyangiaceae bacterium]
MLRFYNTLTQKLEPFEPLTPGTAKVYLCGLTTYDLAHAGHARTNTTFDVLVRHLRARGLETTFVRNVTDVDDKIMKRAKENGEEPLALSARMSVLADEDLAAIGCAKPDHEPRVSTHIDQIVKFIEALIGGGHAYVANTPKGKDVYFSVRNFPSYGKLSHRNIDDLLSGARIETGDIKKDPLDFALWKGDDADWGWPSPWGKGRPGWHIECSAMASEYLGPHFDIHCGGMDLIFPHHENEIAQSEAIHGPEFSKVWLHGGFLNADSEKMSKSLGNFVTIRDVLARNDAEAFRYYLLGTHYRGPLNFELEKHEGGRITFTGIDEAERRTDYLYNTYDALMEIASGAEPKFDGSNKAAEKTLTEGAERVLTALDNDLNTPQGLAVIADVAKAANDIVLITKKAKGVAVDLARPVAAAAAKALRETCAPLGLMQTESERYGSRCKIRRLGIRNLDAADIDAKVIARSDARANKDFQRSDAIRAELAAMGVELLDATGTTSWRVLV